MGVVRCLTDLRANRVEHRLCLWFPKMPSSMGIEPRPSSTSNSTTPVGAQALLRGEATAPTSGQAALTSTLAIDERTTLEEVAALVCSTLDDHGISGVLSGGSVVSIYSNAEYVSYDLDFIPIGLARKADRAMESLGFVMQQRHRRHPRSRYWVEFPAGPVAIGEETIRNFAEHTTDSGTLRLPHGTERFREFERRLREAAED